jgi:hypothetical protein
VNHPCPSHNEAFVAKTTLVHMRAAFEQIVADEAPFETEETSGSTVFDGFGLMLPV